MPRTSSGKTSKSMPRTAGTGLCLPRRRPPARVRRGPVRSCGCTCGALIGAPQGLNPIVRATSMLSMSSVKPPTFCRHDQPDIVGVGRDGEGRLHQHLVEVVVGGLHVGAGAERAVDPVDRRDIFGKRMRRRRGPGCWRCGRCCWSRRGSGISGCCRPAEIASNRRSSSASMNSAPCFRVELDIDAGLASVLCTTWLMATATSSPPLTSSFQSLISAADRPDAAAAPSPLSRLNA